MGFMEKEAKLLAQKAEVEAQLNDQLKCLEEEQEAKQAIQQAVKKSESEIGNVQKDFEDMEMRLQQAAADKETKDAQLKSLADEINHQEELISKMNKKKKHLQECNQKTAEDYQCLDDKANHL